MKIWMRTPALYEQMHTICSLVDTDLVVLQMRGKGWLEKDSFGKYHLTMLGRSNIGAADQPTDSTSLEVQSHRSS
jgi:hypothetical protein